MSDNKEKVLKNLGMIAGVSEQAGAFVESEDWMQLRVTISIIEASLEAVTRLSSELAGFDLS